MVTRRMGVEDRGDPDVVELLTLYRWAAERPEEWDQRFYAVYRPDHLDGPMFCVAGQACRRAGYVMFWEQPGRPTPGRPDWWGLPWAQYVMQPGDGATPGGRGRRVDGLAAELLGLTQDQAWSLFDVGNSLWDVRQAVFDITGVDPAGPAICGATETHEPHPERWPVEPPDVATFCTGIVPVGLAVHG